MGNSNSKTCVFVASSGKQCDNRCLPGGYSFCYGHKCRECYRPIKDVGHYYCNEHTCTKIDCKEFKDGSKYLTCKTHGSVDRYEKT